MLQDIRINPINTMLVLFYPILSYEEVMIGSVIFDNSIGCGGLHKKWRVTIRSIYLVLHIVSKYKEQLMYISLPI